MSMHIDDMEVVDRDFEWAVIDTSIAISPEGELMTEEVFLDMDSEDEARDYVEQYGGRLAKRPVWLGGWSETT